MEKKLWTKHVCPESNTYYLAAEKRYDIYMEDTVRSYEPEYRSHSKACQDYLDIGFLIKDKENLTIDFNGATLVFHGRIQPFMLDNCKHVTLKNMKIDYDRPFYTQASVLECGKNRMKIKIDDGFRYRIEDASIVAISDAWEKKMNTFDCLLWLYDTEDAKSDYPIILALFGNEIFPQENPPMPIGQIYAKEEGDCVVLDGEFPECWTAGENIKLLITHEVRDKNTIQLIGGENIRIEHVQIIHGASMALTAMHTKNIYVDHFDMFNNHEGNGRYVTNNADGIHTYNCYGKIHIKNCTMEGLLDDTVNVHGNYLSADELYQDGSIYSELSSAGLTKDIKLFMAGDRVAVFHQRTQEFKEYLTVKSIVPCADKKGYRVMFVEDHHLALGDVYENVSAQPEILIENCVFNRFRGTMRLQSRSKTVVRNCIFNNPSLSLLFSGDTTYWFEGSPANDYTVEGCEFHYADSYRIEGGGDVVYTEKAPYYHTNITVKNCRFDGKRALRLHHADKIIFKNNTSPSEPVVELSACGEATVEGARLLKK